MANLGQNRGDGRGRRPRIDQPTRVRIKRRGAQAGRQDDAVTIDDIGAFHRRFAGAARRRLNRAAAMQHRDLDKPSRQHQISHSENAGDRQQPVAPDLERILAGTLTRRRLRPRWLRSEF